MDEKAKTIASGTHRVHAFSPAMQQLHQRMEEMATSTEPEESKHSSRTINEEFRSSVSTLLASWATETNAQPRTSPIHSIRRRCIDSITRFVNGLATDMNAFLQQRARDETRHGRFTSGVQQQYRLSGVGTDESKVDMSLRGTFTDATKVWDGFARCGDVATLRDMWNKVAMRIDKAALSHHMQARLDLMETPRWMMEFLHAFFGLNDHGMAYTCTWIQEDIVKHLTTIVIATTRSIMTFPSLEGTKGLKKESMTLMSLHMYDPLPVTCIEAFRSAVAAPPMFTLASCTLNVHEAGKRLDEQLKGLLDAAEPFVKKLLLLDVPFKDQGLLDTHVVETYMWLRNVIEKPPIKRE